MVSNHLAAKSNSIQNKFSLPKFLIRMETMLHDWLMRAIQDDLQTYAKVTLNIMKETWK